MFAAPLLLIRREELVRAQVEAMLPQTEEQYETWARREYPHIMWLYNVVTHEGLSQANAPETDACVDCPTSPPDSPAGRLVSFDITEEGHPSITLPDAEGKNVALCAVVQNGNMVLLPTSSALPPSASCSSGFFSSEKKSWDGVPVHIPEWAQRLYANTPASGHPTGWRALLHLLRRGLQTRLAREPG